MRLPARLVTAGSGPGGIEVVTTKLEKTEAVLSILAGDLAMLPTGPDESFTLEVELPRMHPFGRRGIHCHATLSSVSKAGDGALEVAVVIHRMRFIQLPQSAVRAAVSGFPPGGGLIQ